MTITNGIVISGSEVLVAARRKPRTSDIGLETIDIPNDGAILKVDDSLRVTAVPDGWLYAIGDANGRALTTHMVEYQGRVASDSILALSIGKV